MEIHAPLKASAFGFAHINVRNDVAWFNHEFSYRVDLLLPRSCSGVCNSGVIIMSSYDADIACDIPRKLMSRRKRVGVEPTIRPSTGRIAGFEDREDHRTPCASPA